jgi:RHS repeat-associated protein
MFLTDSGSMANGYSAGDVGNQPLATLYQYDALGNLLRVDQKGTAPTDSTQWRTRTFTYDSLSRLLTATNPESGTISYAYDADGNLLQKTSPAANQTGTATQTVSYCYDALHRVTSKGYGAQSCPLSSPVVSYAYDSGANAKGKLVSLTDQAGTASYAYDTLGRLNTETRSIAGVSKSTGYTYNLDGSVKTLTYPSGRVVTYTPDSAGRLVSAVDGNGTNYVSSASYNPDGSLKNLLNGSTPALNQSFQYTPRLQMCRITALTSGTLPTSCIDTQNIGNIMDRGYDFHAGNGTPNSGSDNGNVFAITNYRDANRSQAFTYDALNRLSSAWSSANAGNYSWGENYSIDAWGNLQISPMGTKAHGGNFTLSGNAQNRPTGLAYDAAGNLMSYVSTTYTYDPENRLSSTSGTSYTYDGNGERVLKSNSSTGAPTKRYWSMGGNTLAEGDGSGNLTAEYIYFGSKRIARIDLPANTIHYYFSDHLGSTSLVASAAGSIEEESDYYPFGTEVIVTGGMNELKFTGKRRDAESGLDDMGKRYHGNVFGRFITADAFANDTHPSAPQSWNLYAYARNNPLRYVDPTGEEIENTDNKKHALSGSQMKHLEKDLQHKTGLNSIHFDETGKLTYDKGETASGGSSKMRDQITAAIDSTTDVFKLGNYSGDDKIQFADTDKGTVNTKTGVTTYNVRFDFSDFQNAADHSDTQANAAFSVGLTLSHEIDHKFPSFTPSDNGPGGVIDFVNGIQKQLGLPTRDDGSHEGTCAKGTCSISFHDQNGQQHLLKWQLEGSR